MVVAEAAVTEGGDGGSTTAVISGGSTGMVVVAVDSLSMSGVPWSPVGGRVSTALSAVVVIVRGAKFFPTFSTIVAAVFTDLFPQT